MKGDFSRDTFDPKNHFARVLMQQGRVQTDADWNEQQAITAYRDETEMKDVIGLCGAPVNDAGFGIATDGKTKTLTISKGRMYVDGILCENDQADLDYFVQPDFPNAPKPLELLSKANARLGIVYLNVWQRHLTALDDGYIREKALGGPDTATRAKTIWQVRVLPVKGPDPEECARLEKERQEIQAKIDALPKRQFKATALKAETSARRTIAKPNELDLLKQELVKVEAKMAEVCGAVECITPFPEWDALIAPSSGKLNARTSPPQPTTDECQIPPSAGYTRLENQLYRVEIHQVAEVSQPNALSVIKSARKKIVTPAPELTNISIGKFIPNATTFKWSRDDGTIVTAITGISGKDVSVHDVGPDDVLGFANGQWVEVSDDSLELNGLPGELIQIQTVNAVTKTITLPTAPRLTFKPELHPKLRRWDGVSRVTFDTWIPLEGGIEVQFSEGTYKTGDYWLIPARTATGDIEWPPFEAPNKNPIAQPPRGIQHHYCRLALIKLNKETIQLFTDCRNLFPPLTKVCGAAMAIHVTETSWRNDDWVSAEQIRNEGLRIFFDTLPDLLSLTGAPIKDSSATLIVSVELPTGQSTTSPDLSTILDGAITLGANYVQWMPSQVVADNLLGNLAKLQPFVRVHVTLKGSCIWSKSADKLIYLDGQALGQPGSQADNKTPRIDLVFPTGGCARASDFESWFYVGFQPETKPPLQVTGVKLVTNQGAAFDITPKQSAQQPTTQIDLPLAKVEITFNRAPDPKSIVPSSVFVFTVDRNKKSRKQVKDLSAIGNTVQLQLVDPVAAGMLEVAGGVDNSFTPATTPVNAQDDGLALDGDYDNATGGDFILPFGPLVIN